MRRWLWRPLVVLMVAVPFVAATDVRADVVLPPANAKFDYQIGGDYALPPGVQIVSRDWFAGEAPCC